MNVQTAHISSNAMMKDDSNGILRVLRSSKNDRCHFKHLLYARCKARHFGTHEFLEIGMTQTKRKWPHENRCLSFTVYLPHTVPVHGMN